MQNETFMHRWFDEVWNNKSEKAIDEMCAENVIANGITDAEGNTIRGIDKYKDFVRTFHSAYPDVKITIEDAISEGDKISVRCKVTGTHTGEGLGIAPTNLPIDITGIAIVKIEDGKIAEAWNEFDFMKMYSQLGALNLGPQDDYETIVHRWFGEVWNKKREAAIDEMLTDESVHHGLSGDENNPVRGAANFKEFYRNLIQMIPDVHVTIKEFMTDGDRISARYEVTGTHRSEGSDAEPINAEVKFTGMGICKVKDGKFVEVWNEVDFMKMYSQVGALTMNTQ